VDAVAAEDEASEISLFWSSLSMTSVISDLTEIPEACPLPLPFEIIDEEAFFIFSFATLFLSSSYFKEINSLVTI